MRRSPIILFALCTLLAGAPCAVAGPPMTTAASAPMPDWNHLTAEQRELLLAPVRERWDENPDRRAHMYEHAQRWRTMTPEQRRGAFRGKQRWDRMDPQQREQARALFDKMRTLPPEQRRSLREQWKTMTPEQRQDWVRKNAPARQP